MKSYETCKGCHEEFHPDGLRGGVCFMCLREPVEDRPLTIFERIMWAGALLALFVAVGMFLFGCVPPPKSPQKFQPITGYHNYQQLVEADKKFLGEIK